MTTAVIAPRQVFRNRQNLIIAAQANGKAAGNTNMIVVKQTITRLAKEIPG